MPASTTHAADRRAIANAVAATERMYPNAHRIVGRWYAGRPYVEVWVTRDRGGVITADTLEAAGVSI